MSPRLDSEFRKLKPNTCIIIKNAEKNMTKKIVPFSVFPGSWGLRGKSRRIAQAEYELEGYDLEFELLNIRRDEYQDDEFSRKLFDLELKHGSITESQHRRHCIGLIKDEAHKSLASLELDYKDNEITELEYQKRSATLRSEPWVNVVGMDFSKKTSLEGSFELDWNDHFVAKLISEGYTGPTPDNIVNQWFMELCRNIAMEEFDGTGDFTADSESNLEAVKRWGAESKSLGEGRKGYS
jgi:hypothetical protein